MALDCLVTFITATGRGTAEVRANSLHQLAVLMPGAVVTYQVRDNGDCKGVVVSDDDLYSQLVSVIGDIEEHSIGM